MASGTLSADSLDQMHMMTLLGSPIMEDVESFQVQFVLAHNIMASCAHVCSIQFK